MTGAPCASWSTYIGTFAAGSNARPRKWSAPFSPIIMAGAFGCRHDCRHDRGINYSQPLQPDHATRWIDHRPRIVRPPHPASTAPVIGALGFFAHEGVDLDIRPHRIAQLNIPPAVAVEGGLREDLACQPHRRAHRGPVFRKHLAARRGQPSSAQMRLRLGGKTPIVFRHVHRDRQRGRHLDHYRAIQAAKLQQQHAGLAVLAKPARQYEPAEPALITM